VLLDNAARKLDVPVEELTTEPSVVVHAKSGRKLGYGDITPPCAYRSSIITAETLPCGVGRAERRQATGCRYEECFRPAEPAHRAATLTPRLQSA
jgi:hypothetical protein